MTTAELCIMIAITIYLAAMVAIGIYWSKKNENVGDFYLGGRKLGPFVTAMSAEASDMSSWLLMGLPGVAYLSGIADATWTAIGLAVGTYINWLIVAKRIRIYSHVADNSITLPDFFSRRYRDDKNILMSIAAVVIIIFFIPYTASGFAACGKLFSSLFGVNYHAAMIISAIVIVAYTATGGFSAASTTDLIQSMVMTVALFVVVFFGIHVAGGLDSVMENARALPGYLSMTEVYSVADHSAAPYGPLTIFSTLAWGLGYFGMPHILLRFMAIEDERKLSLSRRIATIWVVISMTVAVFIGIVGYSMSKVGALPILEGSASETIIVQISGLLSQSGVSMAFLAGIILAGILAATMSTADSQLLAASSSVSHNLLQSFLGIKMSEKKAMTVARCSVIIISMIAAFIARDPNSSVFGIVSFAWAGFGAAFGPVVLAALFWKRSNRQGVLAGMIVGGATVFIWKYLVRPMGGVWNIYELLPAFILSLTTIIVVSLLTQAPDKEITDEFDHVKELCKGRR
ncbi:sodium/proline symporter PutP [Anaerotignum sp. MB30-C6]|uniref:sodium/proline symporter PutP n=1 Tax=Anaerotignum sp. MB30-C6 TaxID=3070814 RepID=UPI0027DB348E|nr:sodium/proline symporter PutP [Anaerotignum sp. MB30-C6]WMI81340.1 sodium/proline symporter PutP [Anaerotignum sp. MB30-C6]